MEHLQAIQLKAAERYVLGELPSDLREQYEEHFFDCAECAEALSVAAAFVENTRAAMGSEPVMPPDRLPVSARAAAGWQRVVGSNLAAELRSASVRGVVAAGGIPDFSGHTAVEEHGDAVGRRAGDCCATSFGVILVARGGFARRRTSGSDGCAGPAIQLIF